MQKRKLFRTGIILLFSFILSFLFFTLNEKSKSTSEIRKLEVSAENRMETMNICKNSSDDIYKHFYQNEYIKQHNTSLNDIKDKYDSSNYTIGEAEEDGIVFVTIKGLIEGEKITGDSLIDVALEFKLYLIFIILGVLSIIAWIFCCCCFCKPCCCCKQSNNEEKCCKCFSFFFMLICFALVFCLSVYGLASTKKVITEFNGFCCSLLSTLLSLIDGEKKVQTPKWEGINGLNQMLNDVIETMRSVEKNMNKSSEDKGKLDNQKVSYQEKMEIFDGAIANSSEFQECFKIPEADENGNTIGNFTAGTTFPPAYLSQVQPHTNPETFFGIINDAYNQVIDIAYTLVETTVEAAGDISSKVDDTAETIGSFGDMLGKFDDQFSSIFNKYGGLVFKYKVYITTYADKALTIFFGVFVVISIILFLFAILYMICKCKLISCLSCIVWNIAVLILFVNFFLAGIIGILGRFFMEASNVVKFAISQKNLDSENPLLLNDKEITQKINICLNGKGDLASEFNIDNYTKGIDDLVMVRDNITEAQNLIKEQSESVDLKSKEDELEKQFSFEFLSVETFNITLYFNALMETNMCGLENMKNDRYFHRHIISDEDLCDDIPFTNTYENLTDDGYCFEFPNTTEIDFGGRYENCSVREDLDDLNTTTNTSDFIKKYIDFVNYAMERNKEVFGKIRQYDSEIKEEFDTVFQIMMDNLNNSKTNIDFVYQIFQKYLGNGGKIQDCLNCKFISVNFGILLDVLHDGFGKLFKEIGTVLGFISIILDLGICFFIIVINRFKKIEDDKKKRKKRRNKGQNRYQTNVPNDEEIPEVPETNEVMTVGIREKKRRRIKY